VLVFFFQAEDGIRDRNVTGVQTCALPIYDHRATLDRNVSLNRLAFSATVHCLTGCAIGEVLGLVLGTVLGWGNTVSVTLAVVLRSEERRVGKESRHRGWSDADKKRIAHMR